MRSLLACALFLIACDNRALEVPEPPPTCCQVVNDRWQCESNTCPELSAARECETLADAEPTYCQVPLTDYCVLVDVAHNAFSRGRPFQTVYCF